MRLRRSIRAPERYEGADRFVPKNRKHDPTQPAYLELMARQVVAFDPAARPAVFPSLPFDQNSSSLPSAARPQPGAVGGLSERESQQEFDDVFTYGDINQQRYSNRIDWHKSNNLIDVHTPDLVTNPVQELESETHDLGYHFPQDILDEMRSSPEPEDENDATTVSVISYLRRVAM